ncbi:hypothetical protein Slin15195_G004770 [Septoria linicola]|uniref:BTB domain-containing protein n=1 Tax=Septoria linicola TaxID=215465 RepID=A0A9Q9AJ77_9PEZI|nr:hypothetical protein Slin14017_G004810 [Septoria linicola]USW47158.1 hypothetical protein Slin15195_G004770 [Septoria linicola]
MPSPPRSTAGNKRKRNDVEIELEETKKKVITLESQLTRCRAPLSKAPKLAQQILFLFVGPEPQFMTLHTNILPKIVCDYLYTITSRPRGFIHLVDLDPQLFALYRLYLYTGQVWSQWDGDTDVEDDGQRATHEDCEWHRLMLLYVLAMTLRDETFANKIIDSIVEKVDETDRYPTDLATEVWESTSEGDRLRKLIVDLHVWKGQGTGVRRPHADQDGPDAFLDMVRLGLQRAGHRVSLASITQPWETAGSRCAVYHSHKRTEYCSIEVLDLTEAGDVYEYGAQLATQPKSPASRPQAPYPTP